MEPGGSPKHSWMMSQIPPKMVGLGRPEGVTFCSAPSPGLPTTPHMLNCSKGVSFSWGAPNQPKTFAGTRRAPPHPLWVPPHPGEDGEEGEGDGSLGTAAAHEEVAGGVLPLVGQEAEAHEPDACPQDWGAASRGSGIRGRTFPCQPPHWARLDPQRCNYCVSKREPNSSI